MCAKNLISFNNFLLHSSLSSHFHLKCPLYGTQYYDLTFLPSSLLPRFLFFTASLALHPPLTALLLTRYNLQFFYLTGIDAGGLTREWYLVLSREIFNCNYALFTAAADGATFQPNPLSMINMNHLDYFKFVGRVIGKAICDGQLMDAHFTRYVALCRVV